MSHRFSPVGLVLAAVLLSVTISDVHAAPAPDQRSVAPPPQARHLSYDATSVATLQTRVRYTTLVVLPPREQIMDVLCGDKEYWRVGGVNNIAYIKPAQADIKTNINILTASGNVYSFVVTETSGSATPPDLKVYIEPTDTNMLGALQDTPKFVPASEVEGFRRSAERARQEADQRMAEFRGNYPGTLRMDYRFDRLKDPFRIEAIWHDGQRTYLRLGASAWPTLYERLDGKPSVVQYETRDGGLYVVSKVVDEGYLQVGKAKTSFRREGR
jgi:type IV secretion system protein VirB9